MSASKTLVSVEEYLSTVYQPDCDYVDGEVLERNMAELDHSTLQGDLTGYLWMRRKEWNITILPEMRVQVRSTRLRIPDICVVLGTTNEQILTKPPFLCIEILSPEDRWSRVEERINDFIGMGVPFVWVLDPQPNKPTQLPPPKVCAKSKMESFGQITRVSKFLSASSSLE
ncbi:MAG: Uma2 family endonuclease [Bryobacterales bacterium]|nr:Uma2 family endonuclease [Bryobacterales bacterium]MBV9402072.1 Uma2 family endonuclease [Bryobacterales bacterium]